MATSYSNEIGGQTNYFLQNHKNGLAEVPIEGVLRYKKKHIKKFRQISHTTCQNGELFTFPSKLLLHGTGILSLKLCHCHSP